MIVHVLAFFVCASLGAELDASAFDDNRYEKELSLYPSGLAMHDGNGDLVELTKDHPALSVRNSKMGDIIFTLYTKQRSTKAQVLTINDTSSLRIGGFNTSKPTYMITHGWMNNGSSPACVLIRDAYLENTDSNVIVVDWSSYSMSPYYIDVTYKVVGVGKWVQKFIKWLYKNGLKAANATLVGHSLGAHVMGIAGFKLTPQVSNVVGLDPALPMFNFADDSDSLTKKDAVYVQIIHTNAGFLGYLSPNGDSDFYPNGGTVQPNCTGDIVTQFACCHDSAFVYFAESITTRFVGVATDSYEDYEDHDWGADPQTAEMGGLNLTSVRPGTYYLRT